MKKLLLILFVAGLFTACAGQSGRQAEEVQAPIELEAELEDALEKNIELNARIEELENELDSLLNTF